MRPRKDPVESHREKEGREVWETVRSIFRKVYGRTFWEKASLQNMKPHLQIAADYAGICILVCVTQQ